MESGSKSTSSHSSAEEKTEKIPSSEYESHLRAMRAQPDENLAVSTADAVDVLSTNMSRIHLDEYAVPNKYTRLLVRPLVPDGYDSLNYDEGCQWLEPDTQHTDLSASAASASSAAESNITGPTADDVLAIAQTSKDIRYTVEIPVKRGPEEAPRYLRCHFYYQSAGDHLILENACQDTISLIKIHPSQLRTSEETPTTPGTPAQDSLGFTIRPSLTRTLGPGTWLFKMRGIEVFDCRILERGILEFRRTIEDASGKRSHSAITDVGVESHRVRRQKVAEADADANADANADADAETSIQPNSKATGNISMRPPADPAVSPSPHPSAKGKEPNVVVSASKSHALLELPENCTVSVQGDCAADNYELTKVRQIASTGLSTVFAGTVKGHPLVPEDKFVIIKIIKSDAVAESWSPLPAAEHNEAIASIATAQDQLKQQNMEHRALFQVNMWERERGWHQALAHENIVKLYAADARHLSLYMEHIAAADLGSYGVWRNTKTNRFKGDRYDAEKILKTASLALEYLHNEEKLVHNDIKPANILYSREHGVKLCDFGMALSTAEASEPYMGGTPYYVPPEFMVEEQRGKPGDVWALGVTMLYVLGKIKLPGTWSKNEEKLYWLIADVHRNPDLTQPVQGANTSRQSQPANGKMEQWLSKVRNASGELDQNVLVERLTLKMLERDPMERIELKDVVRELSAAE